MKILLVGKNGQVGWELARILTKLGELTAIGRSDLDLTDAAKIRQTIRSTQPDVIINAAAYTAVDKAETESELAMAINGAVPGIMAAEAKKLNCTLIHYSTDYVFDGAKRSPYVESDSTNPLNVYGRSKLAGEQAIAASGAMHLIFRTSWVYSPRGSNFLLTVKRLLREKRELRIANDQIGSPTSAADIAEGTVRALKTFLKEPQLRREQISGLYHLTAAGETSWYGFAEEILKGEGANLHSVIPKLSSISTAEYPTPARRPLYSVLSNQKLRQTFGFQLPPWKEGLKKVLTASS